MSPFITDPRNVYCDTVPDTLALLFPNTIVDGWNSLKCMLLALIYNELILHDTYFSEFANMSNSEIAESRAKHNNICFLDKRDDVCQRNMFFLDNT